MAFCWRVNDGPLIEVFGFSSLNQLKKINVVKVGPPLTKLSGSAHVGLVNKQKHSINTYTDKFSRARGSKF